MIAPLCPAPLVLLLVLLLSAGIAVLGSGVGLMLGDIERSRMEMLVHIAAGCLLGITAFDILPEAKSALSWPVFLLACVVGYVLLWAVGRFVFYVCPSCAIAHSHDEALAKKGSIILLATALGIHCLLDGLAISTGGLLSARAEAGALLGVGVHKFPEGLALGLVLVGARYQKTTAIVIATGIEFLTVIGGAGAMSVSKLPTHATVGAIFALVGGGFVYRSSTPWQAPSTITPKCRGFVVFPLRAAALPPPASSSLPPAVFKCNSSAMPGRPLQRG